MQVGVLEEGKEEAMKVAAKTVVVAKVAVRVVVQRVEVAKVEMRVVVDSVEVN